MKSTNWRIWDIRSGKVGTLPYFEELLGHCIDKTHRGEQVLKVISDSSATDEDFTISQRPKIFFQIEGRNRVTHPKGETIVEPGEILIVQSGSPHREERLFHRKRYAHVYTNLTIQRYAYYAYVRCGDPTQKQFNFANGYVDCNKNSFALQMLDELCEYATHNPQEDTELCEGLLQAILLQLLWIIRHPQGQEGEHPLIHSCKRLIHEHLQDPNLSVPRLAEFLQVHPDYLSRLFSEYSEQRLVPYISECRINLAQEILRDLNVNIGEVSTLCGFSERGYFGKVFRRKTGMTPSQYRQREKWSMQTNPFQIKRQEAETR